MVLFSSSNDHKFCPRGGLWNSGGRCHRETKPIFNQTHLVEYPEKMVVLEQVLEQMKTPVIYIPQHQQAHPLLKTEKTVTPPCTGYDMIQSRNIRQP
jgi:hypothetical protein